MAKLRWLGDPKKFYDDVGAGFGVTGRLAAEMAARAKQEREQPVPAPTAQPKESPGPRT